MTAVVAVEHRTLCCTSIENSEDTIIMSGEQGSGAAGADRLVTVATYTKAESLCKETDGRHRVSSLSRRPMEG